MPQPTKINCHKKKLLILYGSYAFQFTVINQLIHILNQCGITAIALACHSAIEGHLKIFDLGHLQKSEITELLDLVKIYGKDSSKSKSGMAHVSEVAFFDPEYFKEPK